MPTTELTVAGMTCDGCERSIARALTMVPGVVSAEASHATGRVLVTLDDAVARQTLVEAVEDAGYDVIPEGKTNLPLV